MPHNLPASLVSELRGLNDKQVFDLLGEILDASIYTPLDVSEELAESLHPISKAYRDEYSRVMRLMDWDDPLSVYYVTSKVAEVKEAF